MLTRHHSLQQQAPTLVKVDPTLARLRLLRVLLGVVMLLWIASLITDAGAFGSIAGRPVLPDVLLLDLSSLGVAFAVFIFAGLLLTSFWKRLERRRQAAARGDTSLLAAEQPVPDVHAFPLPLTIGQRPNWSTFLLLLGPVVALTVIAAIVLLLYLPLVLPPVPGGSASQSLLFIVIGIFVLWMLLSCGLLFGLLSARVREQITVTEHGLIKVGLLGKAQSVSWQEARLFAINGIFGAKKYPYPAIYEVSSAQDIVRWAWIRRNNVRVLFFARPTVALEEYERQMQALLSFIAARTGLPLYDLREGTRSIGSR